jgi:uncharacterized membrane protein YqhA
MIIIIFGSTFEEAHRHRHPRHLHLCSVFEEAQHLHHLNCCSDLLRKLNSIIIFISVILFLRKRDIVIIIFFSVLFCSLTHHHKSFLFCFCSSISSSKSCVSAFVLFIIIKEFCFDFVSVLHHHHQQEVLFCFCFCFSPSKSCFC